MISLKLHCDPEAKEELIAELYAAGTTGIVEEDCSLEAFFDTEDEARVAMDAFADNNPEWVDHGQRDYVAEVAFQQPPYTISLELYEHLKRATPDEYQYLLADMFERITLYDNRTLAAKVSERDDGKFELTLDLQIDKRYADGKGEETPAEQLADWIEVGAYVEREGEDGESTKHGGASILVREPSYATADALGHENRHSRAIPE